MSDTIVNSTLTLRAHPRLYADAQAFDSLKSNATAPAAQPIRRQLQEDVDLAMDHAKAMAAFEAKGHNWHLIRARYVQRLGLSLAVQFRLTDETKYKDAAMRYVQIMHDWEYWSWIMWRQNNPAPDAIYDLSYGENCMTLAVLYDWLHDSLTGADNQLFLATAQRPLAALRAQQIVDDQQQPAWKYWWFKHAQSNWNTVCAGGAGMLALSLADLLPAEEVSQIIQRVEGSFEPYMKQLEVLNGAWPEGIGYWNYGMRYAFNYLLSWENATGQRHWALEQSATGKSLEFPLDFCPNGVPCSFGDVNHWAPLPFHARVARRCNHEALARTLEQSLWNPGETRSRGGWPNAAETLLLTQPPTTVDASSADGGDDSEIFTPFVKLYHGQDWGIVANQPRKPKLYMAIRGGTTEVPHGHMDLTSFHAVMGKQHVICNQGVNEYLDTTFSMRRFELYDTSPLSKNVLLVGGAGITRPSQVVTKEVHISDDIAGLVIDAAAAMGVMRDGPAVEHYVRGFFVIGDEAMLVIDHINLPQPTRLESRLHTPMSPTAQGEVYALEQNGNHAQVHLAASEPARAYQAMSLSTSLVNDVHVLRWIINELVSHAVLATLILPGKQHDGAAGRRVKVACAGEQFEDGAAVTLSLPTGEKTLRFTGDLTALR